MCTAVLRFVAIALPSSLVFADDMCDIQRLIGEPTFSSSYGGQMMIEAGRLIIRDGGALTACPGGGDPFGCTAGALYSYRLEGGQWVDPQFFYPADIGLLDRFGIFDAEGDRLVASTMRRNQDPRLGGLHVYEIDDATGLWVEVERVPVPSVNPAPTLGFGGEVELHGDFVLTSWTEIVFLFQKRAEGWELAQTINRFDPTQPTEHFGISMAMNDDWAVVLALSEEASPDTRGVLYVYRRDDDGLLSLHERVLPPVGASVFGRPMALDGSTLMILGSGTHPAGSIFTYELSGDGLEFVQDITIDGLFEDPPSVGLGMGISIAGDTMVCGSGRSRWRNDRAGYVFKRGSDGLWRYVALLDPEPATPYRVGGTIAHFTATDGRMVVLGAPSEYESLTAPTPIGAAYGFDLACEICQADLDADGALTIFDFLTFLNLFEDGDALADFDGDGELTIFDFLAFQTAFDAGCG